MIVQPNFYIAMIHLLLSTLAMMGLTFLIGFFVAAVIKLIAYAADSFDFYSSHRLELLRLRRWRQHRQKVERLVRQIPIADEDALGDSREDYSRGIDRNFTGYSGYYHGVSPGEPYNSSTKSTSIVFSAGFSAGAGRDYYSQPLTIIEWE